MKNITKTQNRTRRHARIRSRVIGSTERPRLSVFKSNRYLHVQIIDDASGKTLIAGSTKDYTNPSKKLRVKKTDAAKALGVDVAKKAKGAGITTVVFDRGGFRYTGRVATLAEALREGGLKM